MNSFVRKEPALVFPHSSDGKLAFWTGYQVARVQIGDMPRPTDMHLRVTGVFRKPPANGS